MQSYLLHETTFSLGIYMSVSKPSMCFWKQVISIKWSGSETSCLFTTLIWLVIERVHVVYGSCFSWRYESLPRFGIGDPGFWTILKLLQVALSAVLCNGPGGCIMNVWGYQHWNTANTKLDIYLLFEKDHKSTQTKCKVCLNLRKCTTTIDFRLTSVFFINLEHFSHLTLVLLFILGKGKCWLKVHREIFVKIIQWY